MRWFPLGIRPLDVPIVVHLLWRRQRIIKSLFFMIRITCNLNFFKMMFRLSVPTAQKTSSISVTKTRWLMIYREVIAVDSERLYVSYECTLRAQYRAYLMLQ